MTYTQSATSTEDAGRYDQLESSPAFFSFAIFPIDDWALVAHDQLVIQEPSVSERLQAKFERLRDAWLQDTEFSSSMTEIVTHPAYIEIANMKAAVLPLILKDLQSHPKHWFHALEIASGGADPVPSKSAGNLSQMTAAWINWGRRKSII